MTRLLIVAHSYLHHQWQGKLYSLALRMKAVVVIQPSSQASNDTLYHAKYKTNSSCNDNLSLKFLRAILIKSPTFVTYLNIPLFVWYFFRAQPTCVLLEEDPYSSVGILTLTCFYFLKIFKKESKLCLFTWDNLNSTPSNFFKRYLKALACRYSSNMTDGLICGNVEAAFIARKFKHYNCPMVILPYVGVTNKSNNARMFPHHRPITIGFIGRMVTEKGLFTLLESIKLIQCSKEHKLMLVGSGPLLEKLKNICLTNSISAAFPGWVSFDRVNHYLSQIDILVLPSISTEKWKEQFGLVLAQAMLMGIPCVGSSSGAIPQVINNKNLIFQEGSETELASLLSLLINDPAFYESSSLSAYNWSNQCFEDESVGINYSTFIHYISKNQPSRILQDCPYGKIRQPVHDSYNNKSL
jgi:glycosyltransferase involved in cell wall biosynthesis